MVRHGTLPAARRPRRQHWERVKNEMPDRGTASQRQKATTRASPSSDWTYTTRVGGAIRRSTCSQNQGRTTARERKRKRRYKRSEKRTMLTTTTLPMSGVSNQPSSYSSVLELIDASAHRHSGSAERATPRAWWVLSPVRSLRSTAASDPGCTVGCQALASAARPGVRDVCVRQKRSGIGRFATGANACADQPPTSDPSRAGALYIASRRIAPMTALRATARG